MTLILLLALLGGAMLAAHAIFIAPFDLHRTFLDVPVNGLEPVFDGYTIAVIADIHYQPALPQRFLRQIIGGVEAADPDLVVHLGDYATSLHRSRRISKALYERGLPGLAPTIRRLRGRDGAIAVLGNHDHYFDADRVRSWLTDLGVVVLVNEAVGIRRGEAELTIGGVGDAFEGTVDPRGGLGEEHRGRCSIVLSHNPDGVMHLDPGCRPSLVLSGHTHGGQVVLPFIGAPLRFSRMCGRYTASGWIPNEVAPLYVSRGVGAQILLRFRCPPELVFVRLRSRPRSTPALPLR